ncbi:MAG: hypothetical protein ACI90V_003539, partial [Bacillariaceae sp.]
MTFARNYFKKSVFYPLFRRIHPRGSNDLNLL